MGLSSNILWHQTSERCFFEILSEKRLRYSYCLERIIPGVKFDPIAFPMISVSDYPFSEIGQNQWVYGNYCIGFKQEWGVKAGFSPVLYCSYGSRFLYQLNSLIDEAFKRDSRKLFGLAMFLFAHMKFVQSPLQTKNKLYENYRFYDEREWRLVPLITETDTAGLYPFLTEKKYSEFKQKNGGSVLDIGLDFQYEDIHYIIVEKKEDIDKTRGLVGNTIHIFTKDEIIEDMMGIAHHVEILPSQEREDFEAAKRLFKRMREKLEVEFEKRMKKSDAEKQ